MIRVVMSAKKAPEAPEFALLKPSTKMLIRKLGNTPDHSISAECGTAGKGWMDAEGMGWVTIKNKMYGGYEVRFNLTGWERWCRQVDVEEGMDPADLPECEYD